MLEKRERSPELMDGETFDTDLAEASYRFIERTNRLFGGIAPVRNFIGRQQQSASPDRPLRILDIGSGGCDIPIAVCRWAERQHLRLAYTCVEKHPHAADYARRCIHAAGLSNIHLTEADIFSFANRCDSVFDCATASMLFHHLDEEEIDLLLHALTEIVRGPLLICDLKRSRTAYLGCWLFTLRSHPGVKMDARTSVRRSFTPTEMNGLLASHPALTASEVKSRGFLRITGTAYFPPNV